MEIESGDNASMRNKTVLWLDDNESRKKMAQELEHLGLKVDFKLVKGLELEKEIHKILTGTPPGLIIIDHVLDKSKSKLVRTGSTFAVMMKEKDAWKQIPIFGITSAVNIRDLDIEEYGYDELIDADYFRMFADYIPAAISGFERCRRIRTIESAINLLQPPKTEIAQINACLSFEIKSNIDKIYFPNRFHKWFRTEFYALPGFLYDLAWTATLIGVKLELAHKYTKKFKNAKYAGIFDDPNRPRWWKALLYGEIIGKNKAGSDFSSLQQVACEVFKIPKKHRSICEVCSEDWPEIMAYDDVSSTAKLRQMHYRCTVAHPMHSYKPMFEEIRVMK
jgi:hypothetical protein